MDVIEIAREAREALAHAPRTGRTARLAEIAAERRLSVPALRRILEGSEFLDALTAVDPELGNRARSLSPPLLSALRAALGRNEEATLAALRDHFSGQSPLLMRTALALGARPRTPLPASARAATSAVALSEGQSIARAFRVMSLQIELMPAHAVAAPRPVAYRVEAVLSKNPPFRWWMPPAELRAFAGPVATRPDAPAATFAILSAPSRVRDEATRVACRDQFWMALGVATRFAGAVVVAADDACVRAQVEALLDEAGSAEQRWYLPFPDGNIREDIEHSDEKIVVFGRPARGTRIGFFQDFAMTVIAPSLLLIAKIRSEDVLTGEEAQEVLRERQERARASRSRGSR